MPVEMVCGGIYEFADGRGKVFQGTLVCLTQDANGKHVGTLYLQGYAPEVVHEGSERLDKFKLIGRPASPKVGRPRKG
jgi:hypothetical protein